MSLSDSQTQIGKKTSLHTSDSEVSDLVLSLLKNFADEAKTVVPQSKRSAVADDDTRDGINVDEEEEPLEKEADGNARKLFPQLLEGEKKQLLKDVVGEIVGSMLDNLPKDGKDEFLVRCFDQLLPKLSDELQGLIRREVEEASFRIQESPPKFWLCSRSPKLFLVRCFHELFSKLSRLIGLQVEPYFGIHEQVFESALTFLMKTADEAKKIVDKVQEPSDGDVVEEEKPGELFRKLPEVGKEEILKNVFRAIVGSMLDKLPKDGKDEFLVRCFDKLFPKLSGELQGLIRREVEEASFGFQRVGCSYHPVRDVPVPQFIQIHQSVLGGPRPRPDQTQPNPKPPATNQGNGGKKKKPSVST